MREAIIEVGTQILFEIFLLVLSIGFAYISKALTKSEKMGHVALAMSEMEAVVVAVVGELQQTTVEGLKEASSDGKLSKSDIEWLGKQLVDKVAKGLSTPAIDTLNAAGVDIESMIHSIAEAAIAEIKRGA